MIMAVNRAGRETLWTPHKINNKSKKHKKHIHIFCDRKQNDRKKKQLRREMRVRMNSCCRCNRLVSRAMNGKHLNNATHPKFISSTSNCFFLFVDTKTATLLNKRERKKNGKCNTREEKKNGWKTIKWRH